MTKTGRNQPCPCGSSKKFKHCHGGIHAKAETSRALPTGFDADLQQKLRELEAERVQREKQQGLGRGIISAEVAGHRIVAVGNTVHYSKKWKTFQDFLRHYLIDKLGADWFKAEQAKAHAQRHPVVRWYEQAISDSNRLGTKVGDIVSGPMTGAQRAFLNLAYNIYLIAHHAEPAEAGALLATFVDKLKSVRSDDFIGKLFETYAAAAFIKAGFTLAYENESDGRTSHVEFVATYPKTGKKFSVEVKSRNRAATEDGAVDDVKRLRVASKLNRALAKAADHTRVVMIEVNVPDVLTDDKLEGWPRNALDQIRQAEKAQAPDGSDKPSAYVIVTNHAFHNNLDAIGAGTQALAAGCRIPNFGPDVGFNSLKDVLNSEASHQEIFALLDSMRSHYAIPSTFDGQIPEMAYEVPGDVTRLKFGQWYLVPAGDGREVPGRLYEATVLNQTVHGVYETSEGKHIICTSPLTDAEFAAWKKHPETFFGEVRRVSTGVNNWLELAKFFFETYQHTPREKLLEWMKDTPDIAELRKLSDRDLAIVFCERSALAADRDKKVA
ncbi:MAG: YecA family protein [Hyphomicrobium sp.]